MSRTVYTTVTNGRGDKRAEAAHRRAVAQMVAAANRAPCPHGCAANSLCDHGLDDSGLLGRV